MYKHINVCLNFIFIIFFLIGIIILKNFGIGIEENFQRASGFFWLKNISQLAGFGYLSEMAGLKLKEIYSYNLNLPLVEKNLIYGVVLDVPAAFFEILIDFENNANNIYLKHYLSFFIFLISGYFFSRLLKFNFPNFITVIFGTIIYLISPKIFGASFFDGKDLFFLSVFTITVFTFVNYLKKQNNSSLVLFALFSAFATSSRIIGIMIPISFIFIIFLEILSSYDVKKRIILIIKFLFIYTFFLFLHWPYLWDLNFSNSFGDMNLQVFFNGNYFRQDNLPTSYIPKLIFLSTPIYILILFVAGLILYSSRIFFRYLNIKESLNLKQCDLWKGEKEKISLFIFLCFLQTIVLYLSIDLQIYSSWRHFFFVHFFICYFFSYFIFFFVSYFRKKKLIIYFFGSVILILNIEIIHKLIVYHPYQYSYFNNFSSSVEKNLYERDTAHLSRAEALREILRDKKDKKINIGVASWSPFGDVFYMFDQSDLKDVKFTGTSSLSEADYIYTNYMYEVNPNYNKKYEIPNNFKLFKQVKKKGSLIYSVYKKK